MKFKEIPSSILSCPNAYEISMGITTGKIECVLKKDNWAIFIAHKSDNSCTIFYARKGQRAEDNKWNWFCPSESELEIGFSIVPQIYHYHNAKNKTTRESQK